MVPLSHLPEFVERGGAQVWRPPYSAQQADLYGFVLQADQAAIDALLRRDLNHPSGGAVDYRCAHPNVVITFGRIDKEASLDPVDELRGFLAENEVSIWCLVADMNSPGRLLWYLPYIFTNSEQTIATGREIYGYPKQLGYFPRDYPDGLATPGATTSVSALAIHPFSKTTKATPREMISVSRKAGGAPVAGPSSMADELGIFFPHPLSVNPAPFASRPPRASAAIRHASAPPPALASAPARWIKGVLGALDGRALTGDSSDLIADMVANPMLVFLKQFRDISCATKACYQAVIEAPLRFDPENGSYEALDPALFEVTVHSWDSDPIAAELGIATTEVQRAFHARFSFEILLGTEVWRAPT
jgi:hypothetical protein